MSWEHLTDFFSTNTFQWEPSQYHDYISDGFYRKTKIDIGGRMVNKMSRFIKNFIKKETLAHDDHMTKIIQ